MKTRTLPLIAIAFSIGISPPSPAQFIPGEGGTLPEIPALEGIPGQIGGLRVEYCHRRNNSYSTGTHPQLVVAMDPPSDYDATGYDLQYSADGLTDWTTTHTTSSATQDNFSITHQDGFYRLLVLDGPRAGEPSNAIHSPVSTVETRFAGWGLDESFFVTGISSPWVGRGLTASFTVRSLADETDVIGGLSYQWHRVNPLSGEAVPVNGATSPTYETTMDDLGGYYFMCTATGDESTVGGYAQIISENPVMLFNNAAATGIDHTGFTLHLHMNTPRPLTPSDLSMSYWDDTGEVAIPITSVTTQSANSVFHVSATIPDDCAGFLLTNHSSYWKIGESFGEGDWARQQPDLWIQIPSGTPSSYSEWCESVGLPFVDRDKQQCNGPLMIPNLIAYAMGLDPMTATTADMPEISGLDPELGTFSIIHRQASGLWDATLAPQISSDLATWQNATVTGQTVIEDHGHWQLVKTSVSYSGGPVSYLRFAATFEDMPM